MKTISTLLCFLVIFICCQPQPVQTTAEADNKAIQLILTETLTILSGEAGEQRNWEAFLSHFTNDAVIGSISKRDGKQIYHSNSVDSFVEQNGGYYETNDFFEVETGNTISVWNGIANAEQAYNIYTSKENMQAGKIELKGVNFYRLVNTGDEWKIQSIVFAQADEDNPIPSWLKK